MYPIICSALIYTVAFYVPEYLWFCMFVWLTPLLRNDYYYSVQKGWLWGIVCFGLHLAWVIKTSIILYCILVIYYTCYAVIWLWLQHYLIQPLKRNRVVVWLTWVISTATFMYLICYCSLALCDCFEGYPLFSPLLPLVSCPWYLTGLSYLGSWWYMLIIIMINVSIGQLLIKFDSKQLIFVLFLFLFPLLFTEKKLVVEIDKNSIVYLQPTWYNSTLSASELFYHIGRELDWIACSYPHVRCVVLPESSFCYDLWAWRDQLSCWTDLFENSVSIFIGAHRHADGKIFNSMYEINQGSIVRVYDKEHLMPLVERIPWIMGWMHRDPRLLFSYGINDDYSDWEHALFMPMLCSELFVHHKKIMSNKPILFLCNDSWFGCGYARTLAVRCAQLYSLEHTMAIVYVGIEQCLLIAS